jgi:hypothetical protein
VSFRFLSKNSQSPHHVLSTLPVSSITIDAARASLLLRRHSSTVRTRRPPPPLLPHRGKIEAMYVGNVNRSIKSAIS